MWMDVQPDAAAAATSAGRNNSPIRFRSKFGDTFIFHGICTKAGQPYRCNPESAGCLRGAAAAVVEEEEELEKQYL